MKTIKGFKGFNKNLKCRGFQYEIGKTYKQNGTIKYCKNGFHFCDNPLAVFKYYNPSDSRYCEVEGCGEINRGNGKVAVSHISIIKEVSLNDITQASLNKATRKRAIRAANCSIAINEKTYSTAVNSGSCSVALNKGFCSIAINSGYNSIAATVDQYSTAINNGSNSVAMSSGNRSVAVNRGTASAVKVEGEESIAIATGRQQQVHLAVGQS